MDIYEESLELHKKYHGKIEVTPTVPLTTRKDLARAYSPGIAAISKAIAEDSEQAKNLTIKKNTIAIVSDGSAILGLGNLGAKAAIPVMEGKAALFKEFGGVDAFPICLDTQDPTKIIKAVRNIAPVFGGINLEDIAAPQCFAIEETLKEKLDIPVMHDDQHGTAVVVLAGLINAMKLRGDCDRGICLGAAKKIRIVINGAGAAGVAITKLLLAYGFEQVIMSDSKGAIYQGRDALTQEKEKLSVLTNLACRIDIDDPRCARSSLEDALTDADVFIGVSRAGLLTGNMVKKMAKDPIIFALANPEPEIMPDIAKDAGAFVVATGRSDFPNQVNNVLAFPGLFRGALDHNIAQFTQGMFIAAAQALANYRKKPTMKQLMPDPLDRSVAQVVADAVGKSVK